MGKTESAIKGATHLNGRRKGGSGGSEGTVFCAEARQKRKKNQKEMCGIATPSVLFRGHEKPISGLPNHCGKKRRDQGIEEFPRRGKQFNDCPQKGKGHLLYSVEPEHSALTRQIREYHQFGTHSSKEGRAKDLFRIARQRRK